MNYKKKAIYILDLSIIYYLLLLLLLLSTELADNMDRHQFSNQFDFWPDRTIDIGVTCPLVQKKTYSTLSRV